MKIKTYPLRRLKLRVLFFGISLLLWSCQKPSIVEELDVQSNIKIADRSVSEFQSSETFHKAVKVFSELKNRSLQSKTNEDLYNFLTDTDHVREIVTDDMTSYTFMVYRDNQEDGLFENLVLTIDSEEAVRAYLLTYTPDRDTHHIAHHNTISFSGTSVIVELNPNQLANRSTGCFTVTTPMCNVTGVDSNGVYYDSEHVANELCYTEGNVYNITTLTCLDAGDSNTGGGNLGDGDSSGGGTTSSGNVTTNPLTIPCERDSNSGTGLTGSNGNCIDVGVTQTLNQLSSNLSLTSDQIDLIYQFPSIAIQLDFFLNQNTDTNENYDPEAVDLALEMINSLENATAQEADVVLMTLDITNSNLLEGPYDISYYNRINQYIDADLTDPYLQGIWLAHFSAQSAILRVQNPEWSDWKVYWEASKEMIHIALDLGGMVPVIGEVCDLANGIIYTIEGDGVNASLSFSAMIPIAGWFATGAKYAKKTLSLVNGTKTTLKWTVKADGFIHFGASGQLRKVLGITTDNLQAHHIIPWAKGSHPAVQKAAKSSDAFHMNEALNGIPLDTSIHNGSHPNYSNRIEQYLNAIPDNATPQQAYDAINTLINNIRTTIQNNPTTHINDLVF